MKNKTSEKITLHSGKAYLCNEKNKEKNNMKKLFISCPMRGRTDENIRKSIDKMHKIAEIVFDQKLEVIKSYDPDTVPKMKQQSVLCLGLSIQAMADADYFIGIQDFNDFYRGCCIEKDIARLYGIPYYVVDRKLVMPDTIDIERKHWDVPKEVASND